jgi:hypothetical protein
MSPRKAKRLLTRALVLCAAALAVGFGCADNLILSSNHAPIDPHGATPATLRTAEGKALEYFVARSPAAAAGKEPEAYVLFFVGKGDRAERWLTIVAGAWGERPVELWGLNYPGSGNSDGPAKMADVPPAALAVYDAARHAAGDKPIFVHAASFGTTAGLYVAAHRPIAGLILQNPPPLRPLILGRYGWWNLWLLAGPVASRIPGELDSVANGPRVTAPAVFISHGADGVTPASYHRQVIDAYAGPKRVIEMPTAGHDAPLTREAAQALGEGMNWLWESSRNRTGANAAAR